MTPENKLNLHQKLIEIRKSVDYLQKGAKGSLYDYVPSSQALASVRNKMNDLNVLLIPAITAARYDKKIEDKGNGKITITYFTELDMIMKWVDANNTTDVIEVPWYGQGVDIAGEKGVGKALTFAEKYFILKSFNIPTDKDDPDKWQQDHAEPVKGDIKLYETKIKECKDQAGIEIIKKEIKPLLFTAPEKEFLTVLVTTKEAEFNKPDKPDKPIATEKNMGKIILAIQNSAKMEELEIVAKDVKAIANFTFTDEQKQIISEFFEIKKTEFETEKTGESI